MSIRQITRREAATLVAVAALAGALAGCGSGSDTTVLGGSAQTPTFADVHAAVIALYRSHPDIARFEAQAVEYTPRTRDKVMRVCREGGPETGRALESSRVLACAPLIFFFYSYGTRRSVPASVDAARTLYWYAVTHNTHPYEARSGLTKLLRGWGVR